MPMPNDNRQFELLAMQSLLPGLTFSVEKSLDLLNDARRALSLPLFALTEGAASPMKRRGRGRPVGIKEAGPRKSPALVKRRMTAAQRQAVGAASRQRWAIVREAGIKMVGPASPNKQQVERARRIIAKRAAQAQAS